MAIYVNGFGGDSSNNVPIAITTPQDGEVLVWNAEQGAYINAPAGVANEAAVQAYVDGQIQGLLNGAPAALNTLQELADALGGDANFAANLIAQLTAKLNITGGTMTGPIVLPGAPTQPLQAATKSYVDTSIANMPAPLSSLSSLTDVNVSNVVNGQLLSWNGSRWVPSDPSSNYSLPTATTTTLGGVKVDGTTITVNGSGVITAVGGAGSTGPQGARGISVTSAEIDNAGHLKIVLDDGTTIDAGSAVGPQGPQGIQGLAGEQGIQGPAGRSVAAGGAAIDSNGNLQITLTDGTILSAGNVVGPQGATGAAGPTGATGAAGAAGLSITSGTVNSSGRLILTKSDASTIDVGSVVGPQGATGPAGPTGATGATGATGSAGTSYTVNSKSGSVNVYGLSSTTQPGYDLEVDLSNRANKLTTARNISLTGKVTGIGSFDGSSNLSITTSLSGVTTTDVTEGTNQYFTNARARTALSAGTGISYNSSTGVFTLNANTDQVGEGSSNLYFTNNRFDNRLAVSNLAQLADVASTVPTTGQALIWNGNVWTPGTVAGSGGGGTSTGVYKATAQIDYDASGNLSGVTILNGGITAAIATATSTTATVTFTFLGSTCTPLGIQVYGYQRTSNVYVTRALASDFPTRTIIGGGSSGSPTAFSGFDAATNTMTLGLTKAATGASAGVGQTTHCVIQFLLSN